MRMLWNTGLEEKLKEVLKEKNVFVEETFDQLTLVLPKENLLSTAKILQTHPQFQFNQLIDICAVDYLKYGISEWLTTEATSKGFSRGVEPASQIHKTSSHVPQRFAVVYHLLSIPLNQRLRIKVFLNEDVPLIASVVNLWPCANWFEREVFDLFGILFEGHPDLRRILTDYGFRGHPFRKDFPVSGEVQVRYDAAQERVIYEAVDIEERVLVPKVIRHDHRYENPELKIQQQGDQQ